jgi:hypothetical protein
MWHVHCFISIKYIPRRSVMKELLKKFEDLWISVAFAEAGEHETSRAFMAHDELDEGSQEIYQVV